MAYHVYSLGEGLIGRVAYTNKHQWIFPDNNKKASTERPFNSKGYGLARFEYPTGWEDQFAAGIKTIAIIAVPQGVVQLGSVQMILEDMKFIGHVKELFGSLQSIPELYGVYRGTHSTASMLAQMTLTALPVIASGDVRKPTIPDVDGFPLAIQPCSQIDQIPASQLGHAPVSSHPGDQGHSVQSHSYPDHKTTYAANGLLLPSSDHCVQVSGNQMQLTVPDQKPPAMTARTSTDTSHVKPYSLDQNPAINHLMLSNKCSYKNSDIYSSYSTSLCSSFQETICSQGSFTSTADNHLQIQWRPQQYINTSNDISDGQGVLRLLDDPPIAPVVENSKSVGCGCQDGLQNDFSGDLDGFDEFITSLMRGQESCNDAYGAVLASVPVEKVKAPIQQVPLFDPSTLAGSPQFVSNPETVKGIPATGVHHEDKPKLEAQYFWNLSKNQSSKQTTSSVEHNNKANRTNNEDAERVEFYPREINIRSQAIQEAVFSSSKDSSKSGRKRARPGENPRPRPKDRQQIQDRVHELRELIPSSTKCSIDTLLEKTVKYLKYLQTVAEEANDWKKSDKLQEGSGRIGTMDASWAIEFGDRQGRGCPIIVENLSQPRHLLIEMLCEDKGVFLEIADSVRGLGLVILKGVMEVRDKKIWAQFVVKAIRDIHRVEVLWSLMQLLDSNMKPTSDISKSQCP